MIKCNTKIKTIPNDKILEKKMDSSLNQQLIKMADKVKQRVEKEIPDRGFFRNFAENFEKGFKPTLYCKNIALFVERDEMRDGRAFLGVSVLHPTMNKQMSTYIMNGDRKGIMEYLSNKDFVKELEGTVLNLSESLK